MAFFDVTEGFLICWKDTGEGEYLRNYDFWLFLRSVGNSLAFGNRIYVVLNTLKNVSNTIG